MAEITVNSEGLRSSAGVFEEVKKNIQTLLADIQNEMDHVKQNYKGEEADDLYNRFSQLSDDFEERGKVIQEYADFLKETADDWDRVGKDNAGDISGMETDA
ncbi:MAG TPA: WXG100 family type VII secretion target [Candidatus Fimimorpha faecalis]|uniref:WXG100 family type VII secretion target n=1 Tax=Candidatus Fimimorpha faecalis TaxID=2840824 RepID=A0A9D1EE54_9FIRM|nr:WXG100 family type VII secretion target [Candidatus Fimimorpha faecalis]